ncbi:xylulokinase [Lactiplantibacillus carotarum]|uniref:xylulokinase n=1 Tax=Lactiplantibacillus carotarum TaxID=2993456 RepID=UPI00298F3C9E|nr:FGGY-family carbohydrate kinase [Lactiplantibacillus carotarum]
MNLTEIQHEIESGSCTIGLELGSTRIKAVLITSQFTTIASGSYVWENQLINGVWTYDLDTVWVGIQQSYWQMAVEVENKYHCKLTRLKAMGVSAMMHGYLAFDQDGQQLVPFRTWRNNLTGVAADQLTALFDFNIPQRWSIAHLYQAILNGEPHATQIDYLTTLAGYVHWQLSGEKVLGVGDASGMFPIDPQTGTYDREMLAKFNALSTVQAFSWHLPDIFPRVLPAGAVAGTMTVQGANRLDPSGTLQPGCVMAPPEGDAGTGMVATNSVRPSTGNISVGTSAFSMNVLEGPLQRVHRNIDIVTTPAGKPVAMVHVNNCSSDINAWAGIFKAFSERLGVNLTPDQLYETLFLESAKADPDAGDLVTYNYQSGENITEVENGRPLFVRGANSRFTLPNFMQSQLYAAFAPLKIGMDILTREERINTSVMIAQGGLFRTPVIEQQVLANALNMPITVLGTASEGGPWGMAVLAAYASQNQQADNLADFLDRNVFVNPEAMTLSPEPDGVAGYEQFMANYQATLPVEALAGTINSEGVREKTC